jgi:hypothetical protein
LIGEFFKVTPQSHRKSTAARVCGGGGSFGCFRRGGGGREGLVYRIGMEPYTFIVDDVSVSTDDVEGGFELFQFESFCEKDLRIDEKFLKRQRKFDTDNGPQDSNSRPKYGETTTPDPTFLDCDIDTESVSSSDSSLSLYMDDSFSNSMIRRHIVSQVLDTLNLGDMIALSNLIQDHFCESCLMANPVLSEPIYGRADVMMFLSMMIENYPDAILRFNLDNGSSETADVISMTYAVTGTMVFNQPFNAQFAKVKEHWQKVQLFKGIVGNEFLDNMACCWIPVVSTDKLRSDSATNSTKSRRRSSMSSDKSSDRKSVFKRSLKLTDKLPYTSSGKATDRSSTSSGDKNPVFKLRGRVDCEFDVFNKVHQIRVV